MSYLDHINQNYPVRRNGREKQDFRKYVLGLMAEKGVKATVETTGDGKNKNIVIGDPLSAKVVCTAHYDTPAASLFPNLMIPRNMPLFFLYQFVPVILMLAVALGGGYLIANIVSPSGLGTESYMRVFLLAYLVIYYALFFLMYRAFKNPNNHNDNTSGVAAVLSSLDELNAEQLNDAAFILFDNEEKGKKGSKAYCKDHKDAMKDKLIVNFDCVGNGENIIFIAMKKAEQHQLYAKLKESFADSDGYKVYFYPVKGSESNSDYKNFPCGVGCMACKRTKDGLFYTPYIHTPKDTVAKEENIQYLTKGMREFFSVM